jgi:hypothetical protein
MIQALLFELKNSFVHPYVRELKEILEKSQIVNCLQIADELKEGNYDLLAVINNYKQSQQQETFSEFYLSTSKFI